MLKNTATFITTSVFIQIIFFSSPTSSLKVECDPFKTCAEAYTGGSRAADPEDCFRYYLCIPDQDGYFVPSNRSYKCEDGYVFSQSYLYCVLGTTCENQCLKFCRTECSDYIYEKVADYNDCSSFYLCNPGGVKSHHKCPYWKPYFDGSECRKESYACCSCCDECTPFCKEKWTEIADPYDCRSYYLCLDIDYPTNDMKFTCEEGKYFEPSIGKCQREHALNKCKPKCS